MDFRPFFPIEVNENSLKISKLKFAKDLKKLGVGLLEEYNCVISKWKWAKKYFSNGFNTENAFKYSKKTFNLFINENFTKNQINKIIDKILLLEKMYKIQKKQK